MEKQNVTLSLPKSILRKAKILAAKKNKYLSELMREALEDKIREDSGYRKAMNRQLKIMKKGFDLGVDDQIKVSREEIHER